MSTQNRTQKWLRRVDLARATGCNLETIRYYEKIGIMPDPPRTQKNYRQYETRHVSRLSFVMRARELGFSLEEIRGLLALVDGGMQTCAEVRAVAQIHLGDIGGKIADLQKIQSILADTINKCTGNAVPQCAVIDALSENRLES